MTSIIPAFLIATASLAPTDCTTWRQLVLEPLFIHEVTEPQLSLFPDIAVDKVLELDFAPNHSGPSYPYCYALPLLPGQVEAHREYCRQVMNENRESTKKACLAFGILSLHKWIQRTENETWVLYYQQMAAPVDECRKKLLSLQDDEKALLATKTLRQQTGCSFAELCPYTVLETERPKVSIYIAASIDGYIARKDESLDWLHRVQDVGEDYGFHALFDSVDALILGRKTYEVASSVAEWPYKGKRVIVLSNSLQAVREEAELFSGDITKLAFQLHFDGIKHVWIDGGVTISHFLDSQMVDHMTVTVFPVLLGDGVPLFSARSKELWCRLASVQSYPSGIVQLRYDMKKE